MTDIFTILKPFRFIQKALEVDNVNYYMGYMWNTYFWLLMLVLGVYVILFLPTFVASCIVERVHAKKIKKQLINEQDTEDAVSAVPRGLRIVLVLSRLAYACAYFCVAAIVGMFVALLSTFTLVPVWLTILMNIALEFALYLHWNRTTAPAAVTQPEGSQGSKQVSSDEHKSLLADNSETGYGNMDSIVAEPQSSSSVKNRLGVLCVPFLAYPRAVAHGLHLHPVRAFVALLIIVTAAVAWGLSTCYVCLAYFPGDMSFFLQRRLSSQYYNTCQPDTICFSYLTVAGNLSSEMIVNWQIDAIAEPSEHYVLLRKESSGADAAVRINATRCFTMDNISFDAWRIQCWADLTGLQSLSVYYVRPYYTVIEGKTNRTVSFAEELKFRTGPSAEDAPELQEIVFASGGDLAWSESGIALSKAVAANEPLFAIVGGDVSYDNGIAACYRRWDTWFQDWQTYMRTPSNFSVPLLSAPGNHESGSFKQPRSTDNFYIRYFPHQTGLKDQDPQLRDLFHEHVVSNHTVVISLDSWVHTTPAEQAPYLAKTLAAYEAIQNKVPFYHNPAYFSVPSNDSIALAIQQSWVPLFDQYKVPVVFENHAHVYKITYPMKAGVATPDRTGTTYLGDGSWGVPPGMPYNYQSKAPYVKTAHGMSHVWLVRAAPSGMNVHAVSFNTTAHATVEPYPGSSLKF